MDNQNDGLWQGGPWEQPSPAFPTPPAVRLPKAVSRRSVLRPRRRGRRWPWFLGLFTLIAVICLSTVLLDRYFRPRLILQDHFPSIGGDGFYHQEDEEEYSTEPPSIPRAETLPHGFQRNRS